MSQVLKRDPMRVYDKYVTNLKTRHQYVGSFRRFLGHLHITDPNYLLELPKKELFEIMENYTLHLRTRVENGDLRVTSIRVELAGIAHFFTYNSDDVILINWKRIYKLIPKKTKSGGDKPYTKPQIQAILNASTKARNKFLVLFMTSSGARVGAIPVLTLGHMHKIEDCYYVKLYSEEEEEYISFLTPECSRMYEQYLQTRKNEGEDLTPQSPLLRYDYDSKQTKYNQSIGIEAIYDVVSRMVRKAGIERKKIGRRFDIPTDHGFRKFFGTVIKSNEKISYSTTERLLGHEGYLEKSYFLPQIEALFAEYKKAIPSLTINDIEAKNEEIKSLQAQVIENLKLEDKIARLEQSHRNLVDEIMKHKKPKSKRTDQASKSR